MSETTAEHGPTRAEAEAHFLAAYEAWYEGKGDGRTKRGAFVSAAFNLARVMYVEREGMSGE